MKFGRPELFLDKETVRLQSIAHSITEYQRIAASLREPLKSSLDAYTALFIKGFGNNVALLGVARDLFFNSRELLDFYLMRLNTLTSRTGSATPRAFTAFFKNLAEGKYDAMKQPIFDFMKINATYIYHIRKVRNEIKFNPANAVFFFNTDHFELRMTLPVVTDDLNILPLLDIPAAVEALVNHEYSITYNLDMLLPEMLEFWSAFKSAFHQSFQNVIIH